MTKYVVALDLGGTKLDGALVTDEGDIVADSRMRVDTGRSLTHEGLRAALHAVTENAVAHADGGEILGLGVGAPGPMDDDGALIPVNLPDVHGFALRTELVDIMSDLGQSDVVEVGHDAGCLALGEAVFGVARDYTASLSVVVSTGVGCGIVMDRTLVRGARGNAGHIGQMLDASGTTVEEVAAGPHTVAWARERGFTGETGPDLAAAVEAGDAVAREAVVRSARAVGRALTSAVTLLDVQAVVLGGGFINVTPDYRDLVAEEIRGSAALDYAKEVAILAPTLGNDGALQGAASLVLAGR